MGTLTAEAIKKLKTPGRYGDGDGLWLQVSQADPDRPVTKAWLFRFKLRGKARQMGLGSLKDVTLAEARELARDARRLAKVGTDPIEARRDAKAKQAAAASKAMTFKQATLAAIAAREASWGNAEHRRQWQSTLETYAFPTLGHLPVSAIDTALVQQCLEPIWTTRRPTAERVRGRIETVLSWAAVLREDRSFANPARWSGHLEHLLSKRSAAVVHHKALPYADIAAFMTKLRARREMAARALEFCILTATRTSEAVFARWSEIDGVTWTVPAERMKGNKGKRREHRVPLSRAALALLEKLPREGEFLFPGARTGRPIHRKAMDELLDTMGVDVTVHGFRSTFKDWASESTAYPNEISEMALAHSIGSKVEASYRRGDLFEKRARLMEDWAKYCEAVTSREVVRIRA